MSKVQATSKPPPRPAGFPPNAAGRRIAAALADALEGRQPVEGSAAEILRQLADPLERRLGASPSPRRTRDALRLLEQARCARRLGHRRWRLEFGAGAVAQRSGQLPAGPDLQAESVAQRDDLKRTVPRAASNSDSERGARNSRACRRLVGSASRSEDEWFRASSTAHHGRWARWTAQALLTHAAEVEAASCRSPWALAGLLLRTEQRPVIRGHRRQVVRWLTRLLDRGLLVHGSPSGRIGLPPITMFQPRDEPSRPALVPRPTTEENATAPLPAPRPWDVAALTTSECLSHPDERVQALGEAARARGLWRVDTDRARLGPLLEALDREAEQLHQHGVDPLEHWRVRLCALPPRFSSACGYLQAGLDESIAAITPPLPEPGWSRVPPGHLPLAASEVA